MTSNHKTKSSIKNKISYTNLNGIWDKSEYLHEYTNNIMLISYFLFPNEEMIYEIRGKSKRERQIFGVKRKFYSEFEEREIQNIKKIIKSKALLDLNLINDGVLLKYLQYNKWQIEKSITELINREKHLIEAYHIEYSNEINDVLQSRSIYIYGRDEFLRPNVYIEEKYMSDYLNKYSFKIVSSAILYLFNYINNNLLIPGQIESWNVIIKEINCLSDGINTEISTFLYKLSLLFKYQLNMLFICSKNQWSIQNLLNIYNSTTNFNNSGIDNGWVALSEMNGYKNIFKSNDNSSFRSSNLGGNSNMNLKNSSNSMSFSNSIIESNDQLSGNNYQQVNNKLIFSSSRQELINDLNNYIHKDQRPKKFGGNGKYEDKFFPPKQISEKFIVNERVIDLISKESFFNKKKDEELIYNITKELEDKLKNYKADSKSEILSLYGSKEEKKSNEISSFIMTIKESKMNDINDPTSSSSKSKSNTNNNTSSFNTYIEDDEYDEEIDENLVIEEEFNEKDRTSLNNRILVEGIKLKDSLNKRLLINNYDFFIKEEGNNNNLSYNNFNFRERNVKTSIL